MAMSFFYTENSRLLKSIYPLNEFVGTFGGIKILAYQVLEMGSSKSTGRYLKQFYDRPPKPLISKSIDKVSWKKMGAKAICMQSL